MFDRRQVTRGVFICAIMLASTAIAGRYNRAVDLGDSGATWRDLPGADGQTYDMQAFADRDAVAIIFTCNQCPVAKAYEDRLKQLAHDYRDKSFRLIAINVNKSEDLEQMKAYAAQHDFDFPYLFDKSQKTARSYGATCTPHAFLLDKQRRIAYMGAIDDNWLNVDEVTVSYLRDAINSVLAGQKPEIGEARPIGCAIQWKP